MESLQEVAPETQSPSFPSEFQEGESLLKLSTPSAHFQHLQHNDFNSRQALSIPQPFSSKSLSQSPIPSLLEISVKPVWLFSTSTLKLRIIKSQQVPAVLGLSVRKYRSEWLCFKLICLYLSIFPSVIYLSTVFSSNHLSIHPSIAYLSVCPCVYVFVDLSVSLPVCLSVRHSSPLSLLLLLSPSLMCIVCTLSAGEYLCQCEPRFAWPRETCERFKVCDSSIAGDTCGCIRGLPENEQQCQREGRPSSHLLSLSHCVWLAVLLELLH